MTSALVVLAACLAAFLVQATPFDQSPKAFVQSLYAAYGQADASGMLGKNADQVFTPVLLSKIRADQHAHTGEVGKLDHDPLCDCQDSDGLKIVEVVVTPKRIGRVDATVRFVLSGIRKSVHLRLAQTHDGWKVDDVSSSALKAGLQHLLAQ